MLLLVISHIPTIAYGLKAYVRVLKHLYVLLGSCLLKAFCKTLKEAKSMYVCSNYCTCVLHACNNMTPHFLGGNPPINNSAYIPVMLLIVLSIIRDYIHNPLITIII